MRGDAYLDTMTTKPKKSKRITVSLAEEEHAELSALADKYDVSLSWLTRQATVEFLKMQGRGGSQLPFELPVQTRGEQ